MAKQLVYQFEIGGETLTMNFGMYCWELFCEKMDIDPSNLLSVFQGGKTFKSMRMIAYCGIMADDYMNDRPSVLSEKDIAKFLNDDPKMMNDIFDAALNTFYFQGEKKPETGKKKVSRSTKSKK